MEHPCSRLNLSSETGWNVNQIGICSTSSKGASGLTNVVTLENDPRFKQETLDQKSLIIDLLGRRNQLLNESIAKLILSPIIVDLGQMQLLSIDQKSLSLGQTILKHLLGQIQSNLRLFIQNQICLAQHKTHQSSLCHLAETLGPTGNLS